MARLTRVTHKQFAENAPIVESGSTQVEIGQFGSALAGTYVATNDVATLQALPAYSRGWGGAVIAEEQLPTIEDMNAVQRVQSYQTGYLFQEGIAEYDANSEYGIGSLCKVINGANVKLYQSLINENIGNPITDTNAWQEFTIGGDLFVNKSGDTMTGALKIYNNLDIFGANNQIDWTSTTAPSSNLNSGWVYIRDKNSNVIGQLATRYTTGNNFVTSISTRRSVNGTVKASTIEISVASDGTAYTSAPTPASGDNSTKIATTAYCVNRRCTTKPTTTSTASATRPCWVVQNYLNGTSWYRVWSDGFIEQGGTVTSSNSSTQTVTFLKPFANTDYSLVGSVSKNSVSATNNEVITKSATGFTLQHTSYIQFGWVAMGY